MTQRPDRRYVRVYDDDLRRDYPQVWHDDRALATWLRLLSIADKMWPTVPELPRAVRPAPLSMLVDCGLVELMPAHCYRIRGHDAERNARSNAARNAAASRWSNAETMPRRERDENENESPPTPARRGLRANNESPRQLAAREREEELERAHQARLEATQRRIAETRAAG